jgi:hypothetical protein
MANASTWTSRLGRLISTGGRELFDRLRQQLTARAGLLRYRSGHDFAGKISLEKAEPVGRLPPLDRIWADGDVMTQGKDPKKMGV